MSSFLSSPRATQALSEGQRPVEMTMQCSSLMALALW